MGARGRDGNFDDHCTSKIEIVHLYGIIRPIALYLKALCPSSGTIDLDMGNLVLTGFSP